MKLKTGFFFFFLESSSNSDLRATWSRIEAEHQAVLELFHSYQDKLFEKPNPILSWVTLAHTTDSVCWAGGFSGACLFIPCQAMSSGEWRSNSCCGSFFLLQGTLQALPPTVRLEGKGSSSLLFPTVEVAAAFPELCRFGYLCLCCRYWHCTKAVRHIKAGKHKCCFCSIKLELRIKGLKATSTDKPHI